MPAPETTNRGRTRRLLTLAAVLSSLAMPTLPVPTASAWAQGEHPGHVFDPAAPLPVDARLTLGRLDNGVAYVIRPHGNPAGKVGVWLHIKTGSLNELDNQRGMAHFLEHMAFNGSQNFKPFEVVDLFQSLGMTFGQDQNAFTSFEQTAYQLYLPDAEPATLAKGLTFFADVASRLTLDPEEIEKERGVILEEERTGKGPDQRVRDQWLSRLAPGSLIGDRLPIGTSETIRGVTREDFVSYYTKYYTPDNMTVIVVGEIDPAAAKAEIEKAFGAIPATTAAAPNDVNVTPATEQRAIVAHDAELTSAEAAIIIVDDPVGPSSTEGDLRNELITTLAVTAFNRRIENKLAAGAVSFDGGGAFSGDLFNALRVSQASATGQPEKWPQMLQDMTTEVQRARLHGFGERELQAAQSELLAGLEQQAEQEPTFPARVILGQVASAVNTGDTLVDPQQTLDLARSILPTITRDEIDARFSQLFRLDRATFLVTLPTSAGVPEEAQVQTLGSAAAETTPEPELEPEVAERLIDLPPTPGKVVEIAQHDATKVWSAWLDNGVRLHHRFMDEQKDAVQVQITLAGGTLLEDPATRGLTQAGAYAWQRAATRTLTSQQINGYMAGQKISVGGGSGDDALVLNISGSPEDLETGFQLAHRLLTDPLIEPVGFEQWRTQTVQALQAEQTDALAMLGRAMAETIYPADEARALPLNIDEVRALKITEAQAWLDKLLATSPVEVSIVGDIDRDRAFELAALYLGSLAPRDRISDTTLADRRTIAQPGTEPRVAERTVKTQTPAAGVIAGFFASDARNLRDTRLLNMASRILSTRLIKQVREADQLVYSISANLAPGETFPGYGMLLSGSATDPAKTDALAARIDEVFAAFAKEGPTPEELDTVKKQLTNAITQAFEQPGYWAGQLGQLDYRGRRLDDLAGAIEAYNAFTADDIRNTFAKYHDERAHIRVVVKPEGEANSGG